MRVELQFSPFVSWLRLVQTFSLAWLVPYVVRRASDRRFLLGAITWSCAAELTRALTFAVIHAHLGPNRDRQ